MFSPESPDLEILSKDLVTSGDCRRAVDNVMNNRIEKGKPPATSKFFWKAQPTTNVPVNILCYISKSNHIDKYSYEAKSKIEVRVVCP